MRAWLKRWVYGTMLRIALPLSATLRVASRLSLKRWAYGTMLRIALPLSATLRVA